MPQTDGSMTAADEVELVRTASKGRSKGSFKAKLTRQTPVEMSEKRQVLKQESKDSGIVTEMFVRPKDTNYSSTSTKEYARQESSSKVEKKSKSMQKRSQSMKIKRTQSCKVKGERERDYLERTHDDSEIELLTPKQNGSVDDDDKKNPSKIQGMWKKALKSLKNSASEPKLTKKSSLTKKKQNSKEEEELEPETSGVVDPVYSLLKCAADLPKGGGGGGKSPCLVHPHCSGHHPSTYVRYPSGGDSSGSTSKTSSPSSSDLQEIVTEGLGSDFKNYYKLTSPAKKSASAFDSVLPL